MKKSATSQSDFYFGDYVSALPLVIMVLPAIVLSVMGVFSSSLMIVTGLVGIVFTSFLARNKSHYWKTVTQALADPTGLLIFKLFLIVGVYAELLTESQLTGGLTWLASVIDLGPAGFIVFVYIACSVLGTAMGTSVGTIMVMTPVFYPASAAIGADPMLTLAAILSGAATGDHFAPVSDTTIISSSTQKYYHREGSADISDVVKGRLQYAIPAFLISCLCYWLLGAFAPDIVSATPSLAMLPDQNAIGLVMLTPMLVVIVSAIKGRSVFDSLALGIVVGLLLAVLTDQISVEQVFYIEGSQPTGLLVAGVKNNLETIVMIIMMMGAYGILKAYGLLDKLVASLSHQFGKTAKSSELTMFSLVWFLNFLLIGLVARITVIGGPIVNELGKKHRIHPVRRANILDATANSFSFIIPWHIWPLLMIMTVTPLLSKYPYLTLPEPTTFLFITVYPVAIWCIMLFSILTGRGAQFEKEEAIKGAASNE
ncbi:MAG: hypothetical protein HWE10_04735 [Gammaproteobacteria bacterium]|nr:hypothetical protein [Gammaproteobacteria bacterium]